MNVDDEELSELEDDSHHKMDIRVDRQNVNLNDPNWLVRRRACRSIARIGHPARICGRKLFNLILGDTDASVRFNASKAMATLDPDTGEDFAKEIARHLGHEARQQRESALIALGLLGVPTGFKHVSVIRGMLKDTSSVVRRAVAGALRGFGSACANDEDNVFQLVEVLSLEREAETRKSLIQALQAVLNGLGDDERTYFKEPPPVPEPPPDEDPKEKQRREKEKEKEVEPEPVVVLAVRQLTSVLAGDAYSSVRAAAALALGDIAGKAASAQAPQLFAAALRDEHRDARIASAQALAKLGGLCSLQMAEELANKQSEAPLRLAAAEAISMQGAFAIPYSQEIAVALGDVDPEVRQLAAQTLAACGIKASSPHGERLIDRALNEQCEYVQIAAVRALEVLAGVAESAAYASELAKGIAHQDGNIRWGAIKGLKALGRKGAAPYSREIAAALVDYSYFVRRAAAEALGMLGPAAAELSGELLRSLLFDDDHDVRRAAAEALGKQGKSAAPREKFGLVRSVTVRLEYLSILPHHAEAMVKLIYQEKHMPVLIAAVEALGQFGDEAVGPFRDVFDAILMSENDTLKLTSVMALQHLGPVFCKMFKDQLDTLSSQSTNVRILKEAEAAIGLII
ncbi:unnamed protein product [Polarella glacialis]|uniref:HEAT repeat domain-containing protein n=1 Tax=Polarella glacialis TaxID=89957 RepID=A0A813EAC2_POLGL|nr:unnamed protein product [Polarella glacialis]